jgi:hypothetical protein
VILGDQRQSSLLRPYRGGAEHGVHGADSVEMDDVDLLDVQAPEHREAELPAETPLHAAAALRFDTGMEDDTDAFHEIVRSPRPPI